MNHRITLFVLFVAFVFADANAQNRFHRRRGAIFGGLAGAAIGAAIGDKGDNETTGALIGGAVGAVAGGSIGDQKDRRIEQSYRHAHQTHFYQQQLAEQQAQVDWQAQQLANQQYQHQQQQQMARPQSTRDVAATAVSVQDVITMVRRGLGETTVIRYVERNGIQQRLEVRDIIYLHEEGVSEPVINAMQSAVVRPLTFVDPATGARSRPVEELPMMIQPGNHTEQINVPPQPTPAPLIDHTRPYVFPSP